MSLENTSAIGRAVIAVLPRKGEAGGTAIDVRILVGVLCILALAFALTMTTLSRDNFWIDELSSLYFSDPSQPLRTLALSIWPIESNPPLYYFYLYVWRLFVSSADESSIRAASLIPAVLACLSPLVYSSRVMAYERRVAVVLLMSCSYGLLYYATEARGYALLLFFAINVTFLFLSAMHSLRFDAASLRRRLVLLGVFSAGAAWTHFFGILLAASVFSVLLLAAIILRRSVIPVGVAGLLTGAVAVLWPAMQFAYIHEIATSYWFDAFPWGSVVLEAKSFAFMTFGHKWSIILIVGLTVPSLIYTADKRISNKELLVLAITAFALFFAALSLYVPLFFSRYFLVLLPAIYILVAEAIGDAIGRLLARPTPVYLGILLGFAIALSVSWPIFVRGDREDWRQPALVVNSMPACAGASIFVVAGAPDDGDPAFLYGHYLDPQMNIHLIPIQSAAAIEPSEWTTVNRMACPVKIWGGHIEGPQMEELMAQFRNFAPNHIVEPFRKSFLLVARNKGGVTDPAQ
jgi:hypothetical protein